MMQRSFPRRFSALESIFEFLQHALTAMRVEGDERLEVELIIEEVFTNLVKYNKSGRHDIPIRLEKRDDRLWITFTDEDVEPFDITRVSPVEAQTPISKLKPGGRGLHIVREMTESFSYEYEDRTSKIIVVKPMASWHV
jgi:anti-sigma regulatory factor (Ser/Thr protein kinase)